MDLLPTSLYDEKPAEFYYSAGFLLFKNAIYLSAQKTVCRVMLRGKLLFYRSLFFSMFFI